MRIKPQTESDEQSDGRKHTTRGSRSAEHAATRLKNRHVERDFFGRPIEEPDPMAGVTQGMLMRARTGAKRLDAWLVEHGHAASRERAKLLIAGGSVRVDGSAKVKPSTPVLPDSVVQVESLDKGPDAADEKNA